MKILIKNGTIIDTRNKKPYIGDLTVGDGDDVTEIDASGKWVTLGLIDMHVHLREPGQTHKEDIQSGLRAAVAGGFTTVCAMPNTTPVVDSAKAITEQIKIAEKLNLARLLPVCAITKNLDGKELVDIEKTKDLCIGYSDDGKSVADNELLEEFFVQAAKNNVLVLAHCEDPTINPHAHVSEWSIVKRDIELAIKHGVRLHVCHVSTAESIKFIKIARKKYPHLITAEVTPHHIALTSGGSGWGNANFKMAPPLRSRRDQKAIKKALKNGIISAIATDHAPHSVEEKGVAWEKAPNGVIGMETAVGVCVTELFHGGWLKPTELIALFTTKPADILGITPNPADITIIDPNAEWTVDAEKFESKSRNCPFNGRKLRGRVTHTIVDGKVVFPFI